MPKKFVGENSKAAEARARKTNAKEAEQAKKQRELEELYWKDDDKQAQRKQQRKEEQEKKRLAQLEKKAEKKVLLENEMSSLTKSAKTAPAPSKVTRAQIEMNKQPKQEQPKKEILETHLTAPLVENVNRINVDGEEARSVTDAIKILSFSDEPTDKHPEKRMKAAFAAFEDKRLKEMKLQNPNLRMSQMKQMIFKEWQKSSENPMNSV